MTRRSKFVAVIVAGVMVLAVGGASLAQRGPGGPRGPMGMGPFMFGGDRLNLTDQQRSEIRTLMEQQRDGQRKAGENLRTLQQRLQQLLWADQVNYAEIDTVRGQIAAAEAEQLSAQVDLQLKISQILTPEQRKVLAEAKPPRGRRGPGAGNPPQR